MKKITRQELIELYNSNPNWFVLKKLKITQPTLSKLLDENNIPRKKRGGKRTGKIIIVKPKEK